MHRHTSIIIKRKKKHSIKRFEVKNKASLRKWLKNTVFFFNMFVSLNKEMLLDTHMFTRVNTLLLFVSISNTKKV